MTSKYKIPSKGDLIQCPYDDTHMIRVEKFQYHLIKCRKWHPCTELMVCPFNARHESRKEEMRYHITNCPDRVILDQDIKAASMQGNKSEFSFKGNTSVPDYNHNIPDPEEMWSDDDLVYEDDSEYYKRRSWSLNPSQGSETKSEGSVITPARRPATNVDEKTKPIYSYSLGLAEKGKVPANQRQASSSMLMSGPCSSYRNLGSQNFSDTCSNTSFVSSMSGFSSKEEFHACRLKTLGIGRGKGPAITKLAFKGEEVRNVGRPSNAQTPSNAGKR